MPDTYVNRLIDRNPSTVTINDREITINTDYRACLGLSALLHDSEYDSSEQVELLFCNLFLAFSPDEQETSDEAEHWDFLCSHVNEAVEIALWFLRGGEEHEKKEQPVYCDLELDSSMINAAFLKSGVDLDTVEHMHWWTFLARLSELPESMFTRMLYLRRQHRRGKLTKEEKQECERVGWDKIKMINRRKAAKRAAEDRDSFKEMQNRLRAEKGLPPL